MALRQRTISWAMICISAFAGLARAQFAEPFEPNPEAVKALQRVVKVYRDRAGLKVKSRLEIKIVEDELTSGGHEVKAEFIYDRGGAGVVKIKDFTCHFADDVFYAVHDKTDHSFYREEYEDSPYWLMLIGFQDIPYPHLALLWGEPDVGDICMQLHPHTPMIVPTEVGNAQREGRELQRIVISSPNGSMRMFVDPKTQLVESIEHEITDGPAVQPGTKMVTTYTYEYTTYDEPPSAEEMKFDPGERQRVDMLASLIPPPDPDDFPAPPDEGAVAGGAGGGPQRQMAGAIVGESAPGFVLATADGKAVDLEELKGKVVVLDFWATWCGPCRKALPMLHEVARWADEEELPVAIYTINVWESSGTDDNSPDAKLKVVKDFWKKHGHTLPIAMDYSDATAEAYGVSGIPATFVIRSDGTLHSRHSGVGANYVGELKEDIHRALSALESPEAADD